MKDKVQVIPKKTKNGEEYAVIVKKHFGLFSHIDSTYIRKDFAELRGKLLAVQLKAEYKV